MCTSRYFMPFSGLVRSESRGSASPIYFIFPTLESKYYGSNFGSLIVSLSNGNLCLLNPSEGSNIGVTETWHAHDYEPWIAAWNYWDPNVLYSGHYDLVPIRRILWATEIWPSLWRWWWLENERLGQSPRLYAAYVRQQEVANLSFKSWIRLILIKNNRFEAGVTSIQNHPHIEHLLAVGR